MITGKMGCLTFVSSAIPAVKPNPKLISFPLVSFEEPWLHSVMNKRITIGIGVIVVVLSIGLKKHSWDKDSRPEASAYDAAVAKFVPRLLDKQNPTASTYTFADRDDCDVRHEGKFYMVLGTLTVRHFNGDDQQKDFVCAMSFDPVNKQWSEVGTRVYDGAQ